MKAKVLESTERIYDNLQIRGMQITNFGDQKGVQDATGQFLNQMMNSYKAITENLDTVEKKSK